MAINKNKVMDAGRKAYEKGQYDKALKEYLKVVKEDPKDVRVWLKIGDLYTKKQSNTEATETYMKVAKFYSEQGFFKKSVAVYKQILRVDPRLVEVNLKLAELYRQLGLLSDAMHHFEMVAAFFHREGKTREALATLRQLVDLDPENVATRIKLAEVYSKEGMKEDAIREFTTTCDYLRKNGRQEDFIKVAERLLFHNTEDLELCKELATLYLKRNDPRRALAKLQICFKANQNDPSVLALLAQAFQRLDQKGKTVSVLKELARVHTEAGRQGEAREVHEKILLYVPTDPDSLAFLGRSLRPASLADSAVEFDVADIVPQGVPRSEIGRSTGSMPIVEAPPEFEPEFEAEFEPSFEADDSEILDSSLLDSDVNTGFPREDSFVADLELLEEEAFDGDSSSVETQESADEIVKILTETDVYVKYGLNQKAVDHLRRVFELDERNIEARERLQDILIKEGRESEGIAELMILAEHTLTRPDISRGYLMQILALDGANTEAIDFAARYQISLGSGLEVEHSQATHRQLGRGSEGGLSVVEEESELDFDDLAFDEMPMGGEIHQDHQPQDHQPQGTSNPAEVTRRANSGYDYTETPSRRAETVEVDVVQVEDAISVAEVDADELDFDLQPDPLAFDPAAAAEFDASPGFSTATSQTPNPRYSAPAPSTPGPDYSTSDEIDVLDDDLLELDSGDLISEETDAGAPPVEYDFNAPTQSSSSLEDDLDEAEFFLSQGLFSEAKEIIEPLLERYPNNPLVQAKLQEVQVGQSNNGDDGNTIQSVDQSLDVVEEEPFWDETDDTGGPSVVLENPVDDNDADTHFDLGLAYKEMGLLGEAITAFEKVLQVPSKAVQGRMMAGLCHREQGSLSEAISQFKAGLYESRISNAEKYSLYYEIGITYESLQDPQEAMYYYEMVLKKDPLYRDVADRVAGIKGQ